MAIVLTGPLVRFGDNPKFEKIREFDLSLVEYARAVPGVVEISERMGQYLDVLQEVYAGEDLEMYYASLINKTPYIRFCQARWDLPSMRHTWHRFESLSPKIRPLLFDAVVKGQVVFLGNTCEVQDSSLFLSETRVAGTRFERCWDVSV